MDQVSVYQDIAQRTGGNIYIGVVGPVRTGKSTFIKRFAEKLVLPHVEDENLRERARDELPQSGSGRTIMTAEPKFVPEEAIPVQFAPGVHASVRLIDSVGFMIPGASGQHRYSTCGLSGCGTACRTGTAGHPKTVFDLAEQHTPRRHRDEGACTAAARRNRRSCTCGQLQNTDRAGHLLYSNHNPDGISDHAD